MGYYACDPTSDKRCELSGKEKNDDERRAKLCPACWLFGSGGWKRRFRLVAEAETKEPFSLASLFNQNRQGLDEFNRWWLKEIFGKNLDDKLAFGRVTLDFLFPGNSNNTEVKQQIKALLSIMASTGSVGAKGQYGFGQFSMEEKLELSDAFTIINTYIKKQQFKNDANNAACYSFGKFWFFNLEIPAEKVTTRFKNAQFIGATKKETYLPVAFDIRYKLKGSAKDSGLGLREAYYKKQLSTKNSKAKAKEETKKVFGKMQWGSKVFVSHPFKRKSQDNSYNLRVWGFTEETVAPTVQEELRKILSLEKQPDYTTGESLIRLVQQENQGGQGNGL